MPALLETGCPQPALFGQSPCEACEGRGSRNHAPSPFRRGLGRGFKADGSLRCCVCPNWDTPRPGICVNLSEAVGETTPALRNTAQGCRAAATLGKPTAILSYPAG